MIKNLGQVAAIYIGSSAPRNTNLIWLDNTVVPFVFRAYDGSAWSEIATHKWVRAYVDGWLVTLPPRQLADDGDYMLINSNNVNYKITVKDFVKSAVGNPLDFKGIIRVSADFPNPSTLEAGDMYVIITSPVGGTVTDPYSGKTFEDSEKIVWDEVTRSWESLGKIDITVDLTTSYSETEVTIYSSAGKETTIQGATDQLAGVMLPGQYSWLQALSNGSIVPGDPSPLTPLTPAHKHNYNDIINRLVSQQGTGESTIDPMSQKATTDALNLKFDKASVLQVSGAATDKVMSQKAVTDALKTLSDDFNNKLTNYLPLAGGTMTGNIVFNNNLFLNWKDTKGSTYQVLSMKSNDEINIGNASFPLNLYSKKDLFHKRNGESAYKIWDAYNLPDPVTLSGNNTFTGNNTFQAGKFNVGPFEVTSSGGLLSNISSPAGSAWSKSLVFRANNDIPSSLVFGGYNSVDNTNLGYAYIGIGDINYQTAQYKFYANSLRVPYQWSIDGPDGAAIIWSQTSAIVNLGRAAGTTKIRSGNTDLIHTKGSTEYIIWDKSNLPNPASTTDLANYLPLIGGTLTGQLTIKQSVDIKLRLQSTDADNHCIIQAINSQASQLGAFGYAGDKWAITHNGTYYEIWDKYNLTNPVTYTTNTYNHATLTNKDGQYFTYIKAGTNGLLPHSKATLVSGGSGSLGTSDQSFNAAYINNLHTNKITFGKTGPYITGSTSATQFLNAEGGSQKVATGGLYVGPSYASDALNLVPANGIYSRGIIYIENGIGFRNSIWTNDLTPNRNYSGYLQVLDAYDASSAGGPTNYGTVLQVNSRNAHWANQLWFPGSAEASKKGLYYRHMSYNETTYGEWHRLLTNKDVNILSASYNNNPNSLPTNQIFYAETQGVAGTPTSNGLLFSVQGDGEGIQLWAGSNRTELYYRTKWTSFGKWIKLATTSDIGNYLPLTGGTLSGNLTINTVGSPTLVINNNDTNGSETFMRVLRKGTASAAIGFRDSLGAYIYNYNSNKYLFIDNDGYARVGTTSGSTRLALITDIPTVSGYLPLSGGTLSGNLTINTVGSPTLVINNNDTNGSETFMRVLRKGTASAAIGFRDSLGAYIYNYNSNKYLFIDNDGYARVGTTSGSTRLALITDIPTVSGYLPLSGGTLTGALTMSSRRNNVVVDVVGGAGQSWNEGAGALSVQVPSDSRQTPLLLARRSGATINTTTLSERLLDMALLDTGTIFRVGMSGVNALELEVTSFTNKVGIGKLFGKTIATTDQIPSIPSISISNSGSGNAVTAISASGHTLTVTKGATYLTSHQTIYNLTFQAGTFAAKTFDPNGAAATVNIPTKTSHLTNDSGFITSSALSGYATRSWANGQFAPLSRFNTSTGYTTIKVTGQEFNFDSATSEIYMNYRTLSGSTAVTKITWKGGSNSTLCEGRWGNLYMNDNLVATQSWVNSQNFVKSTSTKKVTDIQPVDVLPATQASGVLYLVFG